MKKRHLHLLAGLSLSLLLFGCGQQPQPTPDPAASAPPGPYADGQDHGWQSADTPGSPAKLLSALSANTFSALGISLTATSGWGPIELNTSNGEQKAGDGHPISIGGVEYQTGLGVHANSEIHLSLTGLSLPKCTRLSADVGVDDEVGNKGSVEFQVFADGQKLFDSGVMRGGEAAKHFDVSLGGKKDVRLVVTNGGDNFYYDHADWANPVISCEAGQPAGPSGSVDSSFKQIKPDFTPADSAVQSDGKIVVFGTGSPVVPGGAPEFVIARYNADGSPDSSFGTNGKTVVIGGSFNTAYRVIAQPDGKILAAGRSRFPNQVDDKQVNVALLRLLPNGQPDGSFGTKGVALAGTALRGFSDFAVQGDGKIVVVEGANDFGVVRFKADGSLDSGFGTNGRVTTVSTYSTAQVVAVQSDGKIVAGGAQFDAPPSDPSSDYGGNLFVRYNPNGSLDTGFGNGGRVTANDGRFPGRLNALAVQGNGGILYGGAATGIPRCSVNRLKANGGTDTSFRFVGFSNVGNTYAKNIHLAVQNDAKIVVAGCEFLDPNTSVVFRLKPDGMLDTTFGQAGIVTVQDNNDVNIQPSGNILVGLDPIVRLFP